MRAINMNTSMNEMEKYYFDGFAKFKFSDDPHVVSTKNSLKSILENKIKDGFELKSKYTNTYDLRPLAFEYDDSFLEILTSTGAYQKLCKLVGTKLGLFHVQARVSSESSNLTDSVSYMDWHRDTYFKDGKIMGYFPAPHKIIFYPSFDSDDIPRLKLLPGSHRMNVHYDQSYSGGILNNFDKSLLSQVPHEAIKSNDNEFVFFNTAILHGAHTDFKNTRSIRLIYSFLLPDQILSDHHPEHHKVLSKKFNEKIKDLNIGIW
jgi:hypothetical protein